MFNLEDLKTLITIILAILGWIIVHRLNTLRDRDLKRREIVTNHLFTRIEY
jgi:hypothetical protein